MPNGLGTLQRACGSSVGWVLGRSWLGVEGLVIYSFRGLGLEVFGVGI